MRLTSIWLLIRFLRRSIMSTNPAAHRHSIAESSSLPSILSYVQLSTGSNLIVCPCMLSILYTDVVLDAVFFASYCGVSRSSPEGTLVPANRVENDRRCRCIREAIRFAKANNLLGVMFNAVRSLVGCIGTLLTCGWLQSILVRIIAMSKPTLSDRFVAGSSTELDSEHERIR